MIEVKFIDKDGNILSLDEILALDDGVLAVVTHPEQEGHEGHAFTFQTVDEALGDAATLNVAFKTGRASTRIHLLAAFTTLVGGKLEIYEVPTWTTNTGTATTVYNHLRDENPIKSTLLEDKTATPAFTKTNKVLVNVTGLAGGTAIWSRYAWGEKGKIEGGDYRAENEFILRPDTQYAVLFTAIGAANKGQIFLNWIEH